MKKYSDIDIKDIVDYDEKIIKHKNYLKMLNIIEPKCAFIGITGNHEIIEKFKKDIIHIEKSYEWWACKTSYVETITYIKASKELFKFLRKYKTFYKYGIGMLGNFIVEETSFGIDDIAFFDNKDNILLGTNTHEGYTMVTKIIDEEFNK